MKTYDQKHPSLKERISKLKIQLTSKEGMINVSVVVGLLLFVLLVVKACEPAKGSILYGVCGAFLEQQITYPETIEPGYVEQYGLGVRIYYTHIDSFGQYLSEFIECSFHYPPEKNLQLKAVVFNTIKGVTMKTPVKNKGRLYAVEQEYIDDFNNAGSTGAIISGEPDLTLPYNDPLFL